MAQQEPCAVPRSSVQFVLALLLILRQWSDENNSWVCVLLTLGVVSDDFLCKINASSFGTPRKQQIKQLRLVPAAAQWLRWNHHNPRMRDGETEAQRGREWKPICIVNGFFEIALRVCVSGFMSVISALERQSLWPS